jgi:hypothetical protein
VSATRTPRTEEEAKAKAKEEQLKRTHFRAPVLPLLRSTLNQPRHQRRQMLL